MRMKDLTPGQHYVMAAQWRWKQGLAALKGPYGADRVEVVETNAARRYHPGGSWRASTANNGVKVRLLNEDGTPRLDNEGEEMMRVVRSAEIRMEWEEFSTKRAEAVATARRFREERLSAREQQNARLAAALDVETLDTEGLPYSIRHLATIHADGSYSTRVNLGSSELVSLLEAAHAAGRKSERDERNGARR